MFLQSLARNCQPCCAACHLCCGRVGVGVSDGSRARAVRSVAAGEVELCVCACKEAEYGVDEAEVETADGRM